VLISQRFSNGSHDPPACFPTRTPYPYLTLSPTSSFFRSDCQLPIPYGSIQFNKWPHGSAQGGDGVIRHRVHLHSTAGYGMVLKADVQTDGHAMLPSSLAHNEPFLGAGRCRTAMENAHNPIRQLQIELSVMHQMMHDPAHPSTRRYQTTTLWTFTQRACAWSWIMSIAANVRTSLLDIIKTAFAHGGCDGVRTFLLSQFLFESSKLFHGNLFFLVKNLVDPFHFLDVMHEH